MGSVNCATLFLCVQLTQVTWFDALSRCLHRLYGNALWQD